MKFFCTFLLIFLTLLGCHRPAELQGDPIDFTQVKDLRITLVFNEQKKEDRMNRLRNPIVIDEEAEEPYKYYSYLSLRGTNEFTLLIGNHYTYGKYELVSPTELILKSEQYGDFRMEIVEATDRLIQVKGNFNDYPCDYMVRLDDKDVFYLNMVNDLDRLTEANDYSAVSFNEWRNKPQRPETKEEIRARIIAHLEYMCAYMRVHVYGDFEWIHFAGIYSPFVLSEDGVILLDWLSVPHFWKNIFYDDKDADKAYYMIKYAMDATVSPPYRGEHWLIYDEACLQNLKKTLESWE